MEVDEPLTAFCERPRRRQPAVHVGTRTTVMRHDSREDDFLVVDHETSLDGGFRCSGSYERWVGAASDQQLDRLDQHRLSRAGLPGECRHPGCEHETQGVDHAEIGDPQLDQHQRSLRRNIDFNDTWKSR